MTDFAGKINLDPVNGVIYGDAATYNWGSEWRMMDLELLNKLAPGRNPEQVTIGNATIRTEWDADNKGFRLVNEKLGTCVFFPAAGYCMNARLMHVESEAGCFGAYWSSSPYNGDMDHYGHGLIFHSSRFDSASGWRDIGCQVRPITER